MQKSWSDYPITLTPDDVTEILHLGKNNAYLLFHRNDFPSVRIGRKLLVSRDALKQWLEKNA